MADFELDPPAPEVTGRSIVPGLLDALKKHAEKNGRLVQAVNAVARYACDQDERMQLLVDKGLLVQLRVVFKETKFVAPRAAIAQCLSLFASRNRFRDVVGVRYGFVSSGITRLIMFHSLIGLPPLDMDDAERAKVFPKKPEIEQLQVRMGALNGAAMQELVLGLIVLLRLCCVSSESAAAAAKLPTVALLLDFLELFGDGSGHRYQFWQLNVLKLMQNMLSHDAAARELASSRPLLSRFLGLLSKSSDHFMSREERVVSTGVLQGVFNMTSQLRLHSVLAGVDLANVLVRYAVGAAVECVAAESWLDDAPEDDSELPAEPATEAKAVAASAAEPSTESNRAIILRSTQLCVACMVNLAAGEDGCDALIPKVLGHGCPAMWELLMVNDNGVQLTLLRLFWRLYVVSRRGDRLADSEQVSRAGYALQQAAILRCCLRISNSEPVLFEAMQILDAIAVPESVARIPSEHRSDSRRSSGSSRDLQTPLGFAELQEEVMTRGPDVGHLFALLTTPPSNRTGDAALRLVFRCAHNAPPAAVVQIAQQLLELCADADISGETPLLRIGPPNMLRRAVCWVHHIINIDEGDGRLELVDALAPQLLTEAWVPVLVDCFRTALESSLTKQDDTGTTPAQHKEDDTGARAEIDEPAEDVDEDSRPCGPVPLKSVLEYFRELCDMLLTLSATAGGYGMASLLNARMDGGHADGAGVGLIHCVLACVGIYSKQLWASAETKSGGGVLSFVYGNVMGEINELCLRLLLRFAIHKPALLGTSSGDVFEAKRLGLRGLVRDGKDGVGWLSWAVSRVYWLESLLLCLHHCSRPTQVLAAAQLLLLATEPAQSPDGFAELLSVKQPPIAGETGSTAGIPGYVFEALVTCIRRVWNTGAATNAPSGRAAQADDAAEHEAPLRFEAVSDAVTLTHHICHVLTRLLASLDVDGPFFVVSGGTVTGSGSSTQEPSSPRRRSAPLVEQLVSTLVLLAGESSLRESDDYAFLLTILLPLWHLATSPIHASVLQTANRGSLVTSLSHWLRSHLVGPSNPSKDQLRELGSRTGPVDDGRFEPGATPPPDILLQLRVRTGVCGILCCMSRLQASHRELVTRQFLSGLLRAVGIDNEETAAASSGDHLHTGDEVWEDFVLGILRNILLADRSEQTAVALRPFIPWLAACLTAAESDPAGSAALPSPRAGKSGVGAHTHHPRMVPAPHVRTVVDLMSETLMNRETLKASVAERSAKLARAAAKRDLREQRDQQVSEGLQWNERGERGVMAGAADVPKAMTSAIGDEFKKFLAEGTVG
jgi:hypothetical protein|eukprot:COSAG06_NODE_600_length_13896_cov_3.494020_4_plen_1289_part_00